MLHSRSLGLIDRYGPFDVSIPGPRKNSQIRLNTSHKLNKTIKGQGCLEPHESNPIPWQCILHLRIHPWSKIHLEKTPKRRGSIGRCCRCYFGLEGLKCTSGLRRSLQIDLSVHHRGWILSSSSPPTVWRESLLYLPCFLWKYVDFTRSIRITSQWDMTNIIPRHCYQDVAKHWSKSGLNPSRIKMARGQKVIRSFLLPWKSPSPKSYRLRC